jgi:hypothetical protein
MAIIIESETEIRAMMIGTTTDTIIVQGGERKKHPEKHFN